MSLIAALKVISIGDKYLCLELADIRLSVIFSHHEYDMCKKKS